MEVAPLIITPNDMVVKLLLSVHIILYLDGRENLFSKGVVLALGDKNIFIVLEVITATYYFGLFLPWNQ